MALDIHPLTLTRIPDLALLFGEGGDAKWCWCTYFRVRGRNWTNSSPDENRAILRAAAPERDEDPEAPAPGLVAYDDGHPVGWTSLGPRGDYERLAYSRVLAPVDDTPVWSIVCFVVGRRSRGKGVGRALLTAAIEYARARGATTLEAYPVGSPDGGRVRAANAYAGPLSMFEHAGFTAVDRRQWNANSPVRLIMRLGLGPSGDGVQKRP